MLDYIVVALTFYLKFKWHNYQNVIIAYREIEGSLL